MSLSLDHQFSGHEGPINHIQFSSDSRFLISAGYDHTIRLWSEKEQKNISILKGHLDSVNSFVLNDSNAKMISGGSDNALCWWDVTSELLIKRVRCHDGAINSVCMNNDNTVIVSGSFDSKVKIWDARDTNVRPIQVLMDASDSITSVVTSRYEIFASSADGTLRTYDIRNQSLTTDNINSRIVHLDISKDGVYLLLSTMESKTLMFSKSIGEVRQTFRGIHNSKYYVKSRFVGEDRGVLSGSDTGEAILWDINEATVKERVSFGEGPILDVASSLPFVSIALASSNGKIGVFKKAKKVE